MTFNASIGPVRDRILPSQPPGPSVYVAPVAPRTLSNATGEVSGINMSMDAGMMSGTATMPQMPGMMTPAASGGFLSSIPQPSSPVVLVGIYALAAYGAYVLAKKYVL
jgi:hypothetical protein